MKLTKYGFHLDLLEFSESLSVLGILVSIIGTLGGFALFWNGSDEQPNPRVTFFVIGGVLVIPYIIMWSLLEFKTIKQDIPSIEKIGKVYSYVSGSLEIIGEIALIIFNIKLNNASTIIIGKIDFGTISIGSAIYLIFACLKILGIRIKNSKLLGTYLVFRYALVILHIIVFIVLSILTGRMAIAALIVGIVYFIPDIGLTVILHSIRVDREKNARTMNDDLSNNVKDVEEGEKVEASAEHGDGEMESEKQV